ncbi:MAG: hypothetical protein V2B13_12595 [Pseudomonadota bacterium]
MANITLKVDSRLLEEARRIALKKKTSVNALFSQQLKEFVTINQRKHSTLEGLDAFYRKSRARIGKPTWSREDLHER